MNDLVKRLTIKIGVMEMGERIAWGSDTALMREAVHRIEYLEKRLVEAERDAGIYHWLIDNQESWSWTPTRYNDYTVSGFAANGTGYCGYGFVDALELAMENSNES